MTTTNKTRLQDMWKNGDVREQDRFVWYLNVSCGNKVTYCECLHTGACLVDDQGNIWIEQDGLLAIQDFGGGQCL